MNFVRAVAALVSVAPLLAQYGGPAILARGQSPVGMAASQIDFRPYLTLTGSYDVGLNGVAVDANGVPVNDATFGATIGFGISGFHSWKHTRLGLNYSGSFSRYSRSTYNGLNSQSFELSLSHQFSRHTTFSLSNTAVLYGANHYTPALPPTVEFDPSTTYVPTNDFFDDRTFTVSSQGNLTLQRSTRLSFNLGGDGFLTRRQSTALYGVTGVGAHGDVQYRLTRRSTMGVMYQYMHYSFRGIYSSTDGHTVGATYAMILSKSMQFSVIGGVTRYETVFVQSVPIDPAIAAIIGISSAQRVSYQVNYTPNIAARLSKIVPRGTVFFDASHMLIPGNGLFLTSTSTSADVGYNYTGLRRWAISVSGGYNKSKSVGNVIGVYGGYFTDLNISRQIMRATHGVLGFNARRYDSGDFKNYNKWAYGVRLGLSFSPGDVPIRLW